MQTVRCGPIASGAAQPHRVLGGGVPVWIGSNLSRWGEWMPVTMYLQRARECAELADRAANKADRMKLLEIADAWAEMAKAEAARLAKNEKTEGK